MSTTLAPTDRPQTKPTAVTGSRRLWLPATAVTSLVMAVLPLFWDKRYFFHGDTQNAYTGWWYELGNQVQHGHIPLLSPQAWEAGNYAAEGQWGVFSPLTILIGLVVRAVPDVLAVVTIVKLALIVVGAIGMYLLLRSYRVAPAAAYVGGVLVGVDGQSVTFDWPSWVTGQMAIALLPWAWWLTRRAARGRNPLPTLFACYLIASIGYVYAALYLAIMIVACLVDAGFARDRAAIVRTLGIGVFSALIVVTVYLPGIRTSPVTVRSSWDIASDGRFPIGVSDVFTSVLPTTNHLYLLWCLPLVLWIDPARARVILRSLRGALVGTILTLAWVLGPNQLGPLRWPSRVQPALMVMLVVLLITLVSRSIRVPGRGRILASLAWLVAVTWIAISRDWHAGGTTLLGGAIVAAAIILVAWVMRWKPSLAAVTLGVCTIAMLVLQHAVTPQVIAVDRHSPTHAAGYRTQLPGARGDVLVIGSYDSDSIAQPRLSHSLLVGSSWYLNPATVQNGYSTIRFRAYEQKICGSYNGIVCGRALKTLLSDEPTTGRPWVDLLSISTLVIYRPDFRAARLAAPPAGWTVAHKSRSTVTWVRNSPVPTAGGVVSTSAGLRISEQRNSSQAIRFHVDAVPAGGGTVVLSRLAWPGYTASGATLAAPIDHFLLTAHLSPSSTGRDVTVAWQPPGWDAELGAWWLAVIGGLVWSIALAGLRRRRRRRRRRVPAHAGAQARDENTTLR